jgi:hypothetical protein
MTVSERLLGIRPALAIAGLAGLLVAGVLYRAGLGAQIPDYPVGKADIVARARAVGALYGLDTESSLVVPQPSGSARGQLNTALGVVEARRASLSGELPVSAWQVRVRRDYLLKDTGGDPGGLQVHFSETGELLSASVHEPNRKAPAPSRDDARRIAIERLGAFGLSLDGYEEKSLDR